MTVFVGEQTWPQCKGNWKMRLCDGRRFAASCDWECETMAAFSDPFKAIKEWFCVLLLSAAMLLAGYVTSTTWLTVVGALCLAGTILKPIVHIFMALLGFAILAGILAAIAHLGRL